MTFFVDNCIPRPIAEALQRLGVDLRILGVEFERTDIRDSEWMTAIAQHGWIAITSDNRIRKKPAERDLLKQLKLSMVFLPGGFANLNLWQQAAKIVTWWPAIDAHCKRLHRGRCAIVSMSGKVEDLEAL